MMDRFFENDLFDWSNRNYSETNTTLPSVNIKESLEDFEVEVAAPGFSKGDFNIELNNDMLTISSGKEIENETREGQQFTLKEFSYQSFSRSFTLPDTADRNKIGARYENGILRINIPKKDEAKPRPPKQITVS
jgi:HSP20 family protein